MHRQRRKTSRRTRSATSPSSSPSSPRAKLSERTRGHAPVRILRRGNNGSPPRLAESLQPPPVPASHAFSCSPTASHSLAPPTTFCFDPTTAPFLPRSALASSALHSLIARVCRSAARVSPAFFFLSQSVRPAVSASRCAADRSTSKVRPRRASSFPSSMSTRAYAGRVSRIESAAPIRQPAPPRAAPASVRAPLLARQSRPIGRCSDETRRRVRLHVERGSGRQRPGRSTGM